jgi:hypothetical protein
MYIIVILIAKVKKTGTFLGVPGKMSSISTAQELPFINHLSTKSSQPRSQPKMNALKVLVI